MGITVLSPHDGQPVKVRDQDVGRAVRDRENRIFYVLEKTDGSGYYGAITRAGGEREEQRAIEMEQKVSRTDSFKRDQAAEVHDARGKKRGGLGKKVAAAAAIAALAAAAWFGYQAVQDGDLELPESIDEITNTQSDQPAE